MNGKRETYIFTYYYYFPFTFFYSTLLSRPNSDYFHAFVIAYEE